MVKINYKNYTIVVPTLNEEKNIGVLYDKLQELYPKINVIVADDGSKDNTQKLAKSKGAQVVDRGSKKVHGLTVSVLDGVMHAKSKYIIVMDGDLQHPPTAVKLMINKFENGAQVVVGVRRKILGDWGFYRKAMSKIAIFLGNLRLSKVKCNDIMSGFFGVETEIFQNHIKRNYRKYELGGYKVLFDFLKSLRRVPKYAEIKYNFDLRKYGDSKINFSHIIIYLRSLFK